MQRLPHLRGQKPLVPQDSDHTRGMLALWRERWPILVKVPLTAVIAVALWAISDPIGYVFAVILIATIWLWER